MAATTNVFITGCNRGGSLNSTRNREGLLTVFLSRPNHIVIGTGRDINPSLSATLNDSLPKDQDSRLILLKLDSALTTDASGVVEAPRYRNCECRNPGLLRTSTYYPTGGDALPLNDQHPRTTAALPGHSTTSRPWLKSPIRDCIQWCRQHRRNGQLESQEYGLRSKQMRVELFDEEDLHGDCRYHRPSENPGWLRTDLGNHAAIGAGTEQAPVSVADGISGVVNKIDTATRELTSENFVSGQVGDTFLKW